MMPSPSPQSSLPTPITQEPPHRQLPVELLEDIVGQLHTQELGRFLQSSRLFYHLAGPYLYESISIDLSNPPHPLLFKVPRNLTIKPYSRVDKEPSEAQRKDEEDREEAEEDWDQYEGKPCLHEEEHDDPYFAMRNAVSEEYREDESRLREAHRKPISQTRIRVDRNPSGPLPDRFFYTTHLTIHAHSRTQCAGLIPPCMPNLQVLRIRHDPSAHPNKQLNLCLCEHTQWTDQCNQAIRCVCPLINQLRPREVIFGDVTTGIQGEAIGLWQSPSTKAYGDDLDWPKSVKRVTFIAGMHTGRAYGYWSKDDGEEPARHVPMIRSFLARLPDTVQDLTVVMASWPGGWGAEGQSISFTDVPSCSEDSIFFEGRLEALGVACSGLAKRMEIIGLETLIGRDIKNGIRMTRREIEQKMSTWEWSGRDARKRSQAVIFTAGDVYGRRDVEGKTKVARRACQTIKRALLSDFILAIDKYSCDGFQDVYCSRATKDPDEWFDGVEWWWGSEIVLAPTSRTMVQV